MFLRAPSALPVLSVSVSHMSAPFSALGVLYRPVQQSGIPYHFQLLPAPPFILSSNSYSLRLICLPQPSPLVELSSMRLWFDDLHLFIYLVILVVFDFVRALMYVIIIIIPYVRSSHGKRAFSVIGPRLWNSLPPDTRNSSALPIFRSRLKTHLFKIAFSP